MSLPQTVLSCSYIYHAEELPEPPSQIITILSIHLLMKNIRQSLQNKLQKKISCPTKMSENY